MADFEEGVKKEVAEVKFLIHDLRVEKTINDVIHFQVTLNTDLEIYNIEKVAEMHSEDLLELKQKAQGLRKAYQYYSNAVKSKSPPETILQSGNRYIETIQDICELIINPLWGRFDKMISFLPKDSRSFQAARHYKNHIRWICGVYVRIEHFLEERAGVSLSKVFDLGAEVEDFIRYVIKGYVTEKSSSRVDIYFDDRESAVVEGSPYRLRRTLFNLVMNAVDAMADQQVGVLRISVTTEKGRVLLKVQDDGRGMTGDKIDELLSDKETLDGELHSLGFIFVRQTVEEFGGNLRVNSEPGQGTSITVSLPHLEGVTPPPRNPSKCKRYRFYDEALALSEQENTPTVQAEGVTEEEKPRDKEYGKLIINDFQISRAHFKGCIFAISVDDRGKIDYFPHQPYEQHWDIGHEDLSPMFYQATIRGRVEEEEDGQGNPGLILKTPQSVCDYFEYKDVDESEYSSEKFIAMVRNELVLAGRRLVETGLPADMTVQVTDLAKFFPDLDQRFAKEGLPLGVLAKQNPVGQA